MWPVGHVGHAYNAVGCIKWMVYLGLSTRVKHSRPCRPMKDESFVTNDADVTVKQKNGSWVACLSECLFRS